jgi:site-specific DNA-cytosine methylase
MNVLSLFDGISCGQLALDRAKIPVTKYYASEINALCQRVTQSNYPNTVQLGTVNKWETRGIDFSSVELIIAGSPCQGFSFAGDQLAFNDPRSRLFFVFVAVLRHVSALNPSVKFMLENVKMASKHQNVINDYLGVRPKLVNSALVSAQNRERLYWANWEFDLPSDVNVTMSDIIDGDFWSTREKSYCIDAHYHKGSNFKRYFFRSGRQLVLENGYDPRGRMNFQNANGVMRFDGNRWRKLSVVECERLQTIPDDYTQGIPESARYAAIGNAWTVDVIAHILSCLPRCS